MEAEYGDKSGDEEKARFLTRAIVLDDVDLIKAFQWDACNFMVISWIMNSVVDSIAKSILYVKTAREIWMSLERRFALSSGSRKYKLTREIYSLKQSNLSVNDHYTKLKVIWEELDSLEILPRIGNVTADVLEYIKCIDKFKKENKLFQFLNGINESYASDIVEYSTA